MRHRFEGKYIMTDVLALFKTLYLSYAMLAFYLKNGLSMPGSQVVRQQVLVLSFGGSNPSRAATKHRNTYSDVFVIITSLKNVMKIDSDIKDMTPGELKEEVMRLRSAFRKELDHTGNHRCWINLMSPLPENRNVEPLSMEREDFLKNCCRYYDRNQPNKDSNNQ